MVRLAQALEEAAGRRVKRGGGGAGGGGGGGGSSAAANCPQGSLKSDPEGVALDEQPGGDVAMRALSPWRYVIRHDTTTYPPKYAEAECLCRGCLDPSRGYRETRDLNSVEVRRSMKVLKRRPCPGGAHDEYRYDVEYRQVATACVCVRPVRAGA
uniref:Interleukin-17C-like n=1 Tax=Petromyzon marinus TaxID=7757 RepID=A0AAJ7WLG6_PETMA|nr:interleukin-17C-like [Petromyzon marinus]